VRGEGWGEGRFAVILVYTSNRRANAFYDGKILWIVAAKHKTSKDALRSLAHEAIGHHGIERILNEHATGGWGRLVKDIERLRADRTLGSKALRDVMDRVADLAYFIQVNGGEVAGTLTLVNAARGGKMLTPPPLRSLDSSNGGMAMNSDHSSTSTLPHSPQKQPNTSSVSERLTNSEIARLRQNGKETSDFARKAFSKK